MTEDLPAFAHNLGKPLIEWRDVSNALRQDIENLADAYRDDWSSQPFRRLFVRSCWAMIEGEVFCLKQFALRACELGGKSLSANEHTFLSEIRIIVDENGIAELERVHERTLSNLKQTLKIAVCKFESEWTPDFSGQDWRALSCSLKLRHRITHPKTVGELMISDSELDIHKDAFTWFLKTFGEFQASLLQKYT